VSDAPAGPHSRDLADEIVRLGPWHLDVQVTAELGTSASLEAPDGTYSGELGEVVFKRPRDAFLEKLGLLYPDGMQGRSMLDCACNCGGYLFWAKEAGAGECFGFDVREHWIRQARFLAEHRTAGPTDRMRFEACDLYEVPKLGLDQFDVTMFSGIFYHLPDPVTGLKIAADLTRELLIVNTATRSGMPDGLLAVGYESQEKIMSGVHRLMWRPTGPDVLGRILEWAGFAETRVVWWKQETRNPGWGRLEIMAARTPGLLDTLEGYDPGV
jgi:hypothetical protein